MLRRETKQDRESMGVGGSHQDSDRRARGGRGGGNGHTHELACVVPVRNREGGHRDGDPCDTKYFFQLEFDRTGQIQNFEDRNRFDDLSLPRAIVLWSDRLPERAHLLNMLAAVGSFDGRLRVLDIENEKLHLDIRGEMGERPV